MDPAALIGDGLPGLVNGFELEPYLGAYGHLVVMKADTLAYTHLHPRQPAVAGQLAGPEVRFVARVSQNGPHRVFFEFQIEGTVRRAELTMNLVE